MTAGVRLSVVATCHGQTDDGRCPWSAAGPGADRDAERHTAATGHPTGVEATPAQ